MSNPAHNRTRHEFLLTFFDLPHKYEYKEVNGFILVRQLNSAITPSQWEVAIFSKDNFSKVQEWKRKTNEQSSFFDTTTSKEE